MKDNTMTKTEALKLISDYESDPSGFFTCDNLCTVLDGLPEQPKEGEYTPDEVRAMVEEQLEDPDVYKSQKKEAEGHSRTVHG